MQLLRIIQFYKCNGYLGFLFDQEHGQTKQGTKSTSSFQVSFLVANIIKWTLIFNLD
jgi:hypothetical protein